MISFTTVWWSVKAVPEFPLAAEDRAAMRARPHGIAATLGEIWLALREMPPTMRRLWWMKLFQWYGMSQTSFARTASG